MAHLDIDFGAGSPAPLTITELFDYEECFEVPDDEDPDDEIAGCDDDADFVGRKVASRQFLKHMPNSLRSSMLEESIENPEFPSLVKQFDYRDEDEYITVARIEAELAMFFDDDDLSYRGVGVFKKASRKPSAPLSDAPDLSKVVTRDAW